MASASDETTDASSEVTRNLAELSISNIYPLEGGCTCKYIRYRMESRPLIVHGCHCRWCQRETGSALAINAMIEHDLVTHLGPEPELVELPSESGDGQTYARCPKCRIAVWSNYGGPLLRFVRVGTLDQPDHCPPDIHIFTASKQPWVVLPEGVPAREGFYKRKEVWSEESMRRWDVWQKQRSEKAESTL